MGYTTTTGYVLSVWMPSTDCTHIYPKLEVDSATRLVDSLPHALNVPIVHIVYPQLARVFLWSHCVSVVLVFTPTFTLYSYSLDS